MAKQLHLGERLRLLLAIHERNRNENVVAHLKSLRPRVGDLIQNRNLVHGTVIFDPRYGDEGRGVRWLVRRGGYNRKPQPVTLEIITGLIDDCKALTEDMSSIGRLYLRP
jgi:hypothetical protein